MRFLFFPFPPLWTELVSVPEDSLSVWEADRAELFPEELVRLRVRLPFLVRVFDRLRSSPRLRLSLPEVVFPVRVLERLLVEDPSGSVTSASLLVPVGGAILLYLKEKEPMKGGFIISRGGSQTIAH